MILLKKKKITFIQNTSTDKYKNKDNRFHVIQFSERPSEQCWGPINWFCFSETTGENSLVRLVRATKRTEMVKSQPRRDWQSIQ